MRNIFLKILFLTIFPISLNLAQKEITDPYTELRNDIKHYLSDPDLNNATYGIYVSSLKTGEVLYSENTGKLLIPASSMKVVTTGASLLFLGSEYRFKTEIWTDGLIENDTLKGNLIIKGFGDPTISKKFENDYHIFFKGIVDSLKSRRVKYILGNVFKGEVPIEKPSYGNGWEKDYLGCWYAPKITSLIINENNINVSIIGEKDFSNGKVVIFPDYNFFTVVNNTIVSSEIEKSDVNLEVENNLLMISGKIKKGDKLSYNFAMDDPEKIYISLAKKEINEQGIYILNKDLTKFTELKFLFSLKSKKLSEIVYDINKNSNNLFAESILRVLGLELYGYGSFDNGIKGIKEFLRTVGIEEKAYNIDDGSGLSRKNLFSVKNFNKLLKYYFLSDSFETFYNSLAISGVDGTLAERMRNTPAYSKVHAKTGYLPHVKSLVGYVTTQTGEPLAVSFVINNFTVPRQVIDNLTDNICVRLVRFSREIN